MCIEDFEIHKDYRSLTSFSKKWLRHTKINEIEWENLTNHEKAWTILRVLPEYTNRWSAQQNYNFDDLPTTFFDIEVEKVSSKFCKDDVLQCWPNNPFHFGDCIYNPHMENTLAPPFKFRTELLSSKALSKSLKEENFITSPDILKELGKYQTDPLSMFPHKLYCHIRHNYKYIVETHMAINATQMNKVDTSWLGSMISLHTVSIKTKTSKENIETPFYKNLIKSIQENLDLLIHPPTNSALEFINFYFYLLDQYKECEKKKESWEDRLDKICLEEATNSVPSLLNNNIKILEETTQKNLPKFSTPNTEACVRLVSFLNAKIIRSNYENRKKWPSYSQIYKLTHPRLYKVYTDSTDKEKLEQYRKDIFKEDKNGVFPAHKYFLHFLKKHLEDINNE
ncbi:hypothetical protein MJH12_00335 [bacterium]|nr:hypothetical protein [bacterium]